MLLSLGPYQDPTLASSDSSRKGIARMAASNNPSSPSVGRMADSARTAQPRDMGGYEEADSTAASWGGNWPRGRNAYPSQSPPDQKRSQAVPTGTRFGAYPGPAYSPTGPSRHDYETRGDEEQHGNPGAYPSQRPGQVRQKSWHPYLPTSRNPQEEHSIYASQGQVSPTQTTSRGPPPSAGRFIDHVPDHQAGHHAGIPTASASAAEQAERTFQSSSFPQQHSVLEPSRALSGPKRNRGRASTLSLPHPELARPRMTHGYHLSPTYPINYSGPAGALPPSGRDSVATSSSSLWDDHRSRRDSAMSSMTDVSNVAGTPPLVGYGQHPHQQQQHHKYAQQHSPLLFAPLSPHQAAAQHAARHGAAGYGHPPGSAVGRASNSRPATPVSPLNMEDLSMEDRVAPSGMTASTSALPHRVPVQHHHRPVFEASRMHSSDRPRSPNQFYRGQVPEGNGQRWTSNDGLSPHGHPVGESYFPPEGYRGPAHAYPMDRADYDHHLHASGHHHPAAPMGEAFPVVGDYAQRPRMQQAVPIGQPPVDRIAHSRRRRRPPYSYSSLIAQAISSTTDGRMTLREIYTWISNNYPGMYPMTGPESQGWQNTVRHNLSLNKSFVKVARTAQDIYDSCSSGIPSQSQAARGKGGWWTLDHSVAASQLGASLRGQQDDGADDGDRIPSRTGPTDLVAKAGGGVASAAAAAGGQQRKLLRQRSYSDSVNRGDTTRRIASASGASTAPISRDGSVGGDMRTTLMGRNNSDAGVNHLDASRVSVLATGSSLTRTGDAVATSSLGSDVMPSVLQPRHPLVDDLGRTMRPLQVGRARGFTTSAAEPSPLRLYSTSAGRRDSPPDAAEHGYGYPARRESGMQQDASGRRGSAPQAHNHVQPSQSPIGLSQSHQRSLAQDEAEARTPLGFPRRSSGDSPSLHFAGGKAIEMKADRVRDVDRDGDVEMASQDQLVRSSPRLGAGNPQALERVKKLEEADQEAEASGGRMSISGLLNG